MKKKEKKVSMRSFMIWLHTLFLFPIAIMYTFCALSAPVAERNIVLQIIFSIIYFLAAGVMYFAKRRATVNKDFCQFVLNVFITAFVAFGSIAIYYFFTK